MNFDSRAQYDAVKNTLISQGYRAEDYNGGDHGILDISWGECG